VIDRVALVATRELRAERRQPDGVVAAVTFIAVLVLLESLVVGPQIARDADVASALFWLALAFATILATMRSFDRELEDDALEGLVALPGGRDALFGGKVLSLTIVLLLVAAICRFTSSGSFCSASSRFRRSLSWMLSSPCVCAREPRSFRSLRCRSSFRSSSPQRAARARH